MDNPVVSKPPPSMGGVKMFATRRLDSSLSASFQNISLSGNMSLNQSTRTTNTPRQRSKTPSGKGTSKLLNRSGSRLCRTPGGDRFIADRSNFELSHYIMQQPSTDTSTNSSEPGSENNTTEIKAKSDPSLYARSLTETMLGVSDLTGPRVLSFSQKPKAAPEGYQNSLKVVYQGSGAGVSGITKYRVLPKSPERVLDAPDLVDDYYLNILDWSKTNIVAIALRDQVYLWTAHTAEITRIACDVQPGVRIVSSVGWVSDGAHVLCATDSGVIQVWDAEKVKLLRTLRTPDQARIATMSVQNHQVIQGNRLGTIRHHDLRIADHITCTNEKAHAQEICGIKWSSDGRFYASGGNDNTVRVWDSVNMSNDSAPVCTFTQHLAAVKAMCWSPSHRSVLATGGGTNDRTIKIWNVSSGSLLKSTDTESQVSGLIWSESYREILSSHGFSRNHLAIYKYPDMTKVGEILGHTLRVLQLAISPDETTVASISGDETLRFWRVFPPTKSADDLRKFKGSSKLN